jgi:UDP-glucose 4-epimerase
MRMLITGGAGFVGSHLAERLLNLGHEVDVLDDLSTGRLENLSHLEANGRLRVTTGSVTDEGLLEPLLASAQVVFHLAAVVGVDLVLQSPVRTIETNVLGTTSVLRLASRHSIKVLLTSTSEVYGKGTRLPFSEDDDRLLGPTTRSRWCYSESKAVDEFLALAYRQEQGLPVVIARLFNTVGPRQTGRYGMVLPRFVSQAIAGEPLTVFGDGRQTRAFADVRDVVRALVRLSECAAAEGQVVNVGSGSEITINDLARLVIQVTGSNSSVQYVPYEQAHGDGFEETQRRVPDVARVKALIGWEASTPLQETISAVVEEMSRAQAGGARPSQGGMQAEHS